LVARSRAFPGELLAHVVRAKVLTTLAVIEQTDDADSVKKKAGAFDEVLSQRAPCSRRSANAAGYVRSTSQSRLDGHLTELVLQQSPRLVHAVE